MTDYNTSFSLQDFFSFFSSSSLYSKVFLRILAMVSVNFWLEIIEFSAAYIDLALLAFSSLIVTINSASRVSAKN